MKSSHQMDERPLCARHCVRPEISSESKFVHSTKVLRIRRLELLFATDARYPRESRSIFDLANHPAAVCYGEQASRL